MSRWPSQQLCQLLARLGGRRDSATLVLALGSSHFSLENCLCRVFSESISKRNVKFQRCDRHTFQNMFRFVFLPKAGFMDEERTSTPSGRTSLPTTRQEAGSLCHGSS